MILLRDLLDYGEEEFYSLVKDKVEAFLLFVKNNSNKVYSSFTFFEKFLEIKPCYSHDRCVRKKGKVLFGGVDVSHSLNDSWIFISFKDLFNQNIGSIDINIEKGTCRFLMVNESKSEVSVKTIREVIHYDDLDRFNYFKTS